MSGPTIALARHAADRAACLALRRLVFIDEQQVSEAEEIDGRDDACLHVLARLDGAPAGAARFYLDGDKVKIQRVCTAAAARRRGVGAALIRFILDYARERTPARAARLSSQIHAIDFYEKLGFRAHGPDYLDAGIPHRDMERTL